MTAQQHTIRARTLRMAHALGGRSKTAYEEDDYIKINIYAQNLQISLHSFGRNDYMGADIWDTSQGFKYLASISRVQDDDLLESMIRQIFTHRNIKS